MINNIRTLLVLAVVAGMPGLGMHSAPASAGMMATDEVAPLQQERERVKSLVARPEVAQKLEALGVLSDQDWLLVIIIILLIVIAL